MVIGDLRLCRADHGNDGGFAGTRHADKTGVGEHFQFKLDFKLFALDAAFGEIRRLTGRCGEMAVAEAAVAAL